MLRGMCWERRAGSTGRFMRALGLDVAAGAVLLAVAGSAYGAGGLTVSGRVLNVPRHVRGVSVIVESVDLKDGDVASAKVLSGAAYSLRIPAGSYLMLATAVDPRQKRTEVGFAALKVERSVRSVNLKIGGKGRNGASPAVRRVPRIVVSASAVSAAAAAASSNLKVGDIPIYGPDGRLPGGAQAGLLAGMVPSCQAHGGKVYDDSSAYSVARKTETALANAGLLDVVIPSEQSAFGRSVVGMVSVGPGGGPRVDVRILGDSQQDEVHFVVAGDPEDWDDLGAFLSRVGDHIVQNLVDSQVSCDRAAEPPEPPEPPSLVCDASAGTVCVTFDGSGSGNEQSPRLTAVARQDTVNWDLEWTASVKGYGIPDRLSPRSSAGGDGVVTYYNGTTCDTEFGLAPSSPPSLAQGAPFDSKTELTVLVPDPVVASAGTGTGNPAIRPITPTCPALIGGLPGNFSVTVPLRHGVTTRTVTGGGPFSAPTQTGTSTMKGKITVDVG
jgi:hypothetical protein